MKRGTKVYLVLSFLFLGFGIFFVLNSVRGVTGNAIIEDYDIEGSSILGIVFLLGGFLLMMQAASGIRSELKGRDVGELEKIVLRIGPYIRRTTRFSDDTEILPDTNFLAKYHEVNVRLRKKESGRHLEKYPVLFDAGGYNLVFTQKVIDELTYIPLGKAASLAPYTFVDFLVKYGKAKKIDIVDATPEEDVREYIFDVWKRHSARGKRASYAEERKFKEKADVELLARAYSRGRAPTIILSDDSDVRETASELRQRGVNVQVIDFDKAYNESIDMAY